MPIERVPADVEGNHGVAFDVEDCPQVALNHDGMDGAPHDSGKPVDFMGSQPGVKQMARNASPITSPRMGSGTARNSLSSVVAVMVGIIANSLISQAGSNGLRHDARPIHEAEEKEGWAAKRERKAYG